MQRSPSWFSAALLSAAIVGPVFGEGGSAPLPLGGGVVVNGGQWAEHVVIAGAVGGEAFAAREGGFELLLDNGVQTAKVGFSLQDSDLAPEPIGGRPGRHIYLLGHARVTGLVAHEGVRFPGVVDVLDAEGGRWAMIGAGGVQPAWSVSGAEAIEVDPAGALRLRVSGFDFLLSPPDVSGTGAGRWVVDGAGTVRVVEAGPIQSASSATVPQVGVDWASRLGTPQARDEAHGAGVDSVGRPVIAGSTHSSVFPTGFGLMNVPAGGSTDGFITKLSADGASLVWSTYIGGNKGDELLALEVFSDDSVVAAGITRSPNYPTSPGAYDEQYDASTFWNAVMLRISGDGATLEFSTFLSDFSSGGLLDRWGIEESNDGHILVAGESLNLEQSASSPFALENFPTTVGKIKSDGSDLLFAFDAPCNGFLRELPDGRLIVAGDSPYSGWATPGAYDESHEDFDAWVGIFSAAGDELLAATYFGGSGTDVCRGVGVSADGGIYIAGTTQSPDFPQINAAFSSDIIETVGHGFLARLTPDLADVEWTAVLPEQAAGGRLHWERMTVDASGVATIFGWTDQVGYTPVLTPGSHWDADFATWGWRFARIAPAGNRLLYGSGYRVSDPDGGFVYGLQPLADGRGVLAAGQQAGLDGAFWATPGAFQEDLGCTFSCAPDGWATRFNFFHEGVSQLGPGGDSCLGPIVLNTTRRANAGEADFAIYSHLAPPLALGVLLLGRVEPVPVTIDGQPVWVDLASPFQILPWATTEAGYVLADIEVPSSLAGQSIAAQAAFLGASECGAPGAWLVSEGLRGCELIELRRHLPSQTPLAHRLTALAHHGA